MLLTRCCPLALPQLQGHRLLKEPGPCRAETPSPADPEIHEGSFCRLSSCLVTLTATYNPEKVLPLNTSCFTLLSCHSVLMLGRGQGRLPKIGTELLRKGGHSLAVRISSPFSPGPRSPRCLRGVRPPAGGKVPASPRKKRNRQRAWLHPAGGRLLQHSPLSSFHQVQAKRHTGAAYGGTHLQSQSSGG